MSCIHYKFFSKLDYSAVPFKGPHITLRELKKQIMAREGLNATKGDLQITDADTSEEYTDDEAQIPRLSSVIVRRTPLGGVKPAGKTFIVERSAKAEVLSSRPTDSPHSLSLAQLAKTANLVDANASEEDKISAMMLQSNYEYASINYSKAPHGPLHPNYVCYRCGKAGHHIRECPMPRDKSVEVPKPARKCKGIPHSFMLKAEAGTKGAMLTETGEYVIPAIDAEAYKRGKKERPPFVPYDEPSSEVDARPIPGELLCPICSDLMTDAVVIPCCGNSYCDDCIRTFLLETEEHICFTCQQSGVSPDNLIANHFLRKVVNNFMNGTPNTKPIQKQVQPAAPPPPRLQMSRPLNSRQLDPLRANVPHPPPAILPSATPKTQVQPPAPSPPDPEPMRGSPDSSPETGPHGYRLSVLGLPPPIRPPHPSGHQSRPHHSHRGEGRHWESTYTRREDGPPAHVYIAPPSPVYPSPYQYPPPPQPYPPPYTSGLRPPPPFDYPPQPIYAPGSPGLNPPWIPPGVQPLLPHLGPRCSRPPLSKEYGYRQRHRLDKTSPDEFRSRSRSRIRSRSRSRSPSSGRSYPRSPDSRHNGRSYGRSRSRSRSLLLSPPPLRAGPWEGAEEPAPFRSRSRSPGGFRNRSPGGRQPPPRGLPSYELKGPSPGGHDHSERERHRQWEKEYTEWDNQHCKDYDNQHPSLYHRGRGGRDRERPRMSPLPRDYCPQGRGGRGEEESGSPPQHPPSSSSLGIRSSTNVLNTKTVHKKRPREEPERSHHSADRDDATPAAPPKASNKTVSKTHSDKTKKEKAQKVKPKVKTEAGKTEAIKKKDSNTVETNTANPEDQLSPKRKRVKLHSEASPA